MKKTYQIAKKRATDRFRQDAADPDAQIQFALPLPEVLKLVQEGLMNLALAAFTKLAEAMINWEVGNLVGPENKADTSRKNIRWGSQPGYCVVAGQCGILQRCQEHKIRNVVDHLTDEY